MDIALLVLRSPRKNPTGDRVARPGALRAKILRTPETGSMSLRVKHNVTQCANACAEGASHLQERKQIWQTQSAKSASSPKPSC
jgi:hypothetical protein